MNPSKKAGNYLTTSLNETVYVESSFSTISSQKSPQKSQLVAVHGIGTYAGWFNGLSDILADKQIATSLFDLPGFGRSGKRGCLESYSEWTNALNAVWSHTQETSQKDTFLLGHSLGAVVSLASLKHLNPKPKGIILVVPGLMANPKTWHITNFVIPTFIKAIQNHPDKITFPFPTEVFESIKNGTHQADFLTTNVKPKLLLEILNMTNVAWLTFKELKDIPLLMILSEDDPVCLSSASKTFFNLCGSKDKKLRIFPNTGHDLFVLPEADETSNLIADWILKRS